MFATLINDFYYRETRKDWGSPCIGGKKAVKMLGMCLLRDIQRMEVIFDDRHLRRIAKNKRASARKDPQLAK